MKRKFTLILLITVMLLINSVSAQGDPTHVTALTWNPSGTLLAVSYGHEPDTPCYGITEPYVIRLFNTDLTLNKDLRSHVCTVRAVAFKSDGTQLASVDIVGDLNIWDVTSGEIIQQRNLGTQLERVTWKPNGQEYLTMDDSIAIFGSVNDDGRTRFNILQKNKVGAKDLFTDISWSPDGEYLAVSNGDGTSRIWQTSKSNEIVFVYEGHEDSPVTSVAWNPNGDSIASGDESGTIQVWNPTNGKRIATLTGHTDTIEDLSWSPDGKWLASGSSDGTMRVWNIETETEIETVSSVGAVLAVDWSPDSDLIAYGGVDNATQGGYYNVVEAPQTEVSTPVFSQNDPTHVTALTWNPAGTLLAVSYGYELNTPCYRITDPYVIRLLNLDGSLNKELRGHYCTVRSLSFNSDGTQLASVDNSGHIFI